MPNGSEGRGFEPRRSPSLKPTCLQANRGDEQENWELPCPTLLCGPQDQGILGGFYTLELGPKGQLAEIQLPASIRKQFS